MFYFLGYVILWWYYPFMCQGKHFQVWLCFCGGFVDMQLNWIKIVACWLIISTHFSMLVVLLLFSHHYDEHLAYCRDNLQLLRQRYYYATWKADGTRYMMLITTHGCYLIDRNFCFRRVQMRFPLKSTTTSEVVYGSIGFGNFFCGHYKWWDKYLTIVLFCYCFRGFIIWLWLTGRWL